MRYTQDFRGSKAMKEQVDNSIIAIDKAIMHLTALGINNTTYLLEVKKTLKDLLRQALNADRNF